jgi:hypothetical protein
MCSAHGAAVRWRHLGNEILRVMKEDVGRALLVLNSGSAGYDLTRLQHGDFAPGPSPSALFDGERACTTMAERNLSASQQHWLATQVNRTGALPLEVVLGSVKSSALSFDSANWHGLGRFAGNAPSCTQDGRRGAKRASRVASMSHGSKGCVIAYTYATVPVYGAAFGTTSRLNGRHVNLFLERFPSDGEGQCGTAHALRASIVLAKLTDRISSGWSMHRPSQVQRTRLTVALNRTVHKQFLRVPKGERAAEAVFNAVRQWLWGETWSELSVLKLD